MEPVTYHSMPLEFYEELCHEFFAKLIVDLTPSDGKFAWCALKNRTGYVGITYNAEHASLIEERLIDLLKEEMSKPSSPVFNNNYAIAVGTGTDDTQADPQPKATPKGKSKAKAKGKAKARAEDSNPDPEATEAVPKTKAKAKAKEPAQKRARTAATDAIDLLENDEEEEMPEGGEDEDVWDPLKDL